MSNKILIFIHGGETFDNDNEYLNWLKKYEIHDPLKEPPKKWKTQLFENLEANAWKIISPSMPCRKNAKYMHWKIWFEKYLPYIKSGASFVGHSLGASFLLQYFQENIVGKFNQLHLVSPAYKIDVGGFTHREDFSALEKQFEKIFLHHAKDDVVVPFENSEKLSELIDKAEFIKYETGNHFFAEEGPEIYKFLNKAYEQRKY